MDIEEIWRIREEDVYPALFGASSNLICPLTHELFSDRFSQTQIDPRWLTYGVIEFAPTPARDSWLYVTSGHSNPWNQAPDQYQRDGESGTGVEFIFASTEQGEWAIRLLQSMLAFDVLLGAGRYPGKGRLSLNDRIPLRAPLNGDQSCELRNLVVTLAEHVPNEFQLPSGKVSVVAFTAISDAELEVAKRFGSSEIVNQLRIAGFHPINDPRRRSLM